jgi:hypothetical protein
MHRSPALSALPTVAHGFFGRDGGVSQGRYASLNCGPGSADNPVAVAENRRRALASLEVANSVLLTCYQVHSPLAVYVDAAWEMPPRADAMVTDRPRVALGILTADCLPILFADRSRSIVGAAHAGWRGALHGVAEATLSLMRARGARDIVAAIGPAIQQESYEVGPEFPAPFLAQHQENARFFRTAPREGHFLFDLPGYMAHRLRDQCTVECLEEDTVRLEDRFFSYRRTCLRGGGDYGRHISIIALR